MRSLQAGASILTAVVAALCPIAPSAAQPANDACAAAAPVLAGTTSGDATTATSDGNSPCNNSPSGDVYHIFTPPVAGTYTFALCSGTAWDTVISLHANCPATTENALACDDDGCRPPGASDFGYPSTLTVQLQAGQARIVRISGYDAGALPGPYQLLIVGPATARGACCLNNVCTVQTASVCLIAGAAYRGDYTACFAPGTIFSSYFSTGGAAAIPDNAPLGITSTIVVPDAFQLGDIQVTLNLRHPFCGDIQATLSHAGQTAALIERIGGGQFGDDSDFDGTYILGDSATTTIWQAAVDGALGTNALVPTGSHRAADRYANTVSLRLAFAGTSSAGEWSLNISDNNEFDTGWLDSWSVALNRSSGDPCDQSAGACCFGATCSVTTIPVCSGTFRRFAGAGTACNAPGDLRVPCCKADFNQLGTVTVQDIFDYLNAYFMQQPAADTNGGGVSIQDVFDFLRGYFSGCS